MMKFFRVYAGLAFILATSCNNEKSAEATGGSAGGEFKVSGQLTNSTAKKIYLEEVPAGSNMGTIVDSAALDPSGKYALNTDQKEAMIYNLRLDQNMYPVAAIINDASSVTVDIELTGTDNQFAKDYEIKGSPTSAAMKQFMLTFNNDLKSIYDLATRTDSLGRVNAPDTTIRRLQSQRSQVAERMREYALNAVRSTDNPALALFELGYYQSTANSERFGLQPIDIEEVVMIVNDLAKRFSSHNGVAAVKKTLDAQLEQVRKSREPRPARWVGKAAPDFNLPDVNGKEVSLASFKGKYVLVDFWASWCGPCRDENPNVVKAFNQYKNKNFTVLGVSLDRPGQKAQWTKAIKDDNLAWTQVSDLKFWDSKVVSLYGIDGIPFNVLVDPQGMVIAEDLKGPFLEAKLQEVLK